jgi:hypothetical protein
MSQWVELTNGTLFNLDHASKIVIPQVQQRRGARAVHPGLFDANGEHVGDIFQHQIPPHLTDTIIPALPGQKAVAIYWYEGSSDHPDDLDEEGNPLMDVYHLDVVAWRLTDGGRRPSDRGGRS